MTYPGLGTRWTAEYREKEGWWAPVANPEVTVVDVVDQAVTFVNRDGREFDTPVKAFSEDGIWSPAGQPYLVRFVPPYL